MAMAHRRTIVDVPSAISHDGDAALLPRDPKMAAPVLRPAGLGFLTAERLFLALADDRDAACRHAKVGQVFLHRGGAARSQPEVVLGAPARVAMPFQGDP